ncbi:MAG: 23S rRNA pseudouridine(1911/1915/1917) synthase RluD [Endozoicomonadaceae bacterium]|nr:23S rRNA pseudouridine(1911/1915/1917) synthase RluD [Endozoicomonadaceae bacterium]
MTEQIKLDSLVPDQLCGKRLDQIAVAVFPGYSRSTLQSWIRVGDIKVDGKACKPKDKCFGGELLTLMTDVKNNERWEPEDISLDILFEDDAIAVINKPMGLVVHPAAGNYSGTLLNALLYRYPDIASVPRAGIVHRLDKDTSGLMVVAKTLVAHANLVGQLQERTVMREYEAVVTRTMITGGEVEAPIARHPATRLKMAVVESGKFALTRYRIIHRYRAYTHVRLQLKTGRTHQIRVHMAHIGYPVVGDPLYAGRLKLPKGATSELVDQLRRVGRQMLHARRLGLAHPVSGEYMEWESELPADFVALLELLDEDQRCYAEADALF